MWYVTLYLEDLQCGGSEEGGWWYDVGEPIIDSQLNREFITEDDARDYYESELVQNSIKELNKNRYGKHSVLSDGEYHMHIENFPPESYPSYRPHYE